MVDFWRVYISTVTKILWKYPNTEVGLLEKEDDNLFLNLTFVNEVSKDDFNEALNTSNLVKEIEFKEEVVTISELLSYLIDCNQKLRCDAVEQFLLFGIRSEGNKLFYDYLFHLDIMLRQNVNYDDDLSLYGTYLLEQIQNCFYLLETNIISKVADFKDIRDSISKSHIYWSYLFNRISGLMKMLREYNVDISILEEIDIEQYERFKHGKIKKVNNIEEMIYHYRDVMSHPEKEEIAKTKEGGIRTFIFNKKGEDYILTMGAGKLFFNKHLKKVIRKLSLILNNHKFPIVIVHDKLNKKVLFVDSNTSQYLYPIDENYAFSKISSNIFRLLFKIKYT